jgi:hypothetical protein
MVRGYSPPSVPCCICTRRTGHPATTNLHEHRSHSRRRLLVPSRLVCLTCSSGLCSAKHPRQHSEKPVSVPLCLGAEGWSKHTKSVRCTCPSASSNTLSGLTSRWMMPWPWMYLRAQPSSAIQNLTASSVKVFLEIWNRRSPPLMRSTTKYLHRSAWVQKTRGALRTCTRCLGSCIASCR